MPQAGAPVGPHDDEAHMMLASPGGDPTHCASPDPDAHLGPPKRTTKPADTSAEEEFEGRSIPEK
jgi:hypothetical protein